MTLRLYDTASRSVRDFVPMRAGKVGIYLCGLTVQSEPHIGHLRSGVNYDVLRRWLLRSGFEVTFIRNITDVDDKVLAKSVEQDRPFWAIAYANEVILTTAYRTLNVLPPTAEPRATGHVPEMHELIKVLIAGGHAYPAEDGSGDVYFDVRSFPGYGALSGQRPEATLSGQRPEATESGQRPEATESAGEAPERCKRDAHDFALWKGAKPEEPADASWPSPWGQGRPGWHIECSAMCWRYLGPEFDIHGGGLDLTFPHHENEIAQSKAAGLPFARYWVHHGLLNLGEAKMSKSLGNVIDLAHVAAIGIRPVELRYYLIAPHYRSRIDYSDSSLGEAAVAYRRIEGFVQRAAERVGAGDLGELPDAFAAALDDDLNTSVALAVLHDAVRAGHLALTSGDDAATGTVLGEVRAMLDVLGVDPLDAAWGDSGQDGQLRDVVDALVALALQQRAQARVRKDWAAADAVRDQLKHAGVVVEDTPHGPRWTIGEQD